LASASSSSSSSFGSSFSELHEGLQLDIPSSEEMISSEEWWESNSSSLDEGLVGNLMGMSDIFFVDWKRKG
jgi:hypothetical protein